MTAFLFLLLSIPTLPTVALAAETVDLQWSVCERSPENALLKIGEEESQEKTGEISYFDTDAGDYTAQGISFRVKAQNGNAESSVKVRFSGRRPVRGASCEWDSYGGQAEYSCEVVNDSPSAGDLWSEEQLEFIRRYTVVDNLDSLRRFGPYPTQKWKLEWDDRKIHFDSVEAPSGALMEFSLKVAFAEKRKAEKKFNRWLAENGVALCEIQEPKTKRLFRDPAR